MKKIIKLLVLNALLFTCNYINSQSSSASGLDWIIKSGSSMSNPSQITLDGDTYRGGSVLIKSGDGANGPGSINLNTTSGGKINLNGEVRGGASQGALRVKSDHGYIDVGAQSTSWAHIYTDRPKFIFNKDIWSVSGGFSSYSNSKLYLKTNGTNRMTINTNGKVGIGTPNPVSMLEIVSSGSLGTGTSINWNNAALRVNQQGYLLGFDGNQITANKELYITCEDASKHISFQIYRDTKLKISGNGNVGIGTTNPTSKLTVNGDIKCEKVRVISNVPASDHVFESNYDLRSLKEVEQFVSKNKHLPEVPSAKEFKENGYNIGDMDDILLRKVEELTLYIIEQEKRINTLSEELQNLKAK